VVSRHMRCRAAGRSRGAAGAAGRLAAARDRLRISRAGRARRLHVTLPVVPSECRRRRAGHPSRMSINHEQFLARAAEQMQQSAIRKMGAVLAGGRDIISFAPGYPAPETFPWDAFAQISAELLASPDRAALQ